MTILEVKNPLKIEFTLTTTMSLDSWILIKDQLNNSWPACNLRDDIINMVTQAEKVFRPEKETT